jgi:hypothetical protein
VLSNRLNQLADNRAIVLDNITCTYCGCSLSEDAENTKEHVIGRRFVPKGTLNGCWNLIVRACRNCNSTKSNLENDISAITLVGKMWFDSSDSEEKAINEAQRKSKNSVSNKTKMTVIESHEQLKIEMPMASGVKMTFNMTSPPQIEDKRIYELSRLQLMAFFYFITYDKASRKGGFWLEGFHPLAFAHHGDWGNELQKSFMNTVVNWEPRWIGNTADGYFKSIIRRHPVAECWSWAVEWNKNYRVIGFFGSRTSAQELFDGFEDPKLKSIKKSDESHIQHRIEVKLPEEDDILFEWETENA